jgi:hypothetical protein
MSPLEELLSARGTGARKTAIFIGRIRDRLSLKELRQLAGGIHHNAVALLFAGSLNASRTIGPFLKESRSSKRH